MHKTPFSILHSGVRALNVHVLGWVQDRHTGTGVGLCKQAVCIQCVSTSVPLILPFSPSTRGEAVSDGPGQAREEKEKTGGHSEPTRSGTTLQGQ